MLEDRTEGQLNLAALIELTICQSGSLSGADPNMFALQFAVEKPIWYLGQRTQCLKGQIQLIGPSLNYREIQTAHEGQTPRDEAQHFRLASLSMFCFSCSESVAVSLAACL